MDAPAPSPLTSIVDPPFVMRALDTRTGWPTRTGWLLVVAIINDPSAASE